MSVGQTVLRTDSVRVKLAPDMLERVEKLASDYGMPTATLCAFAVAEWVRTQERQHALARMAVLDASRRLGAEFDMSDERLEKVLGPALTAAMSAILPSLDRETAQAVK
jgi:predicted transcriptional regulator